MLYRVIALNLGYSKILLYLFVNSDDAGLFDVQQSKLLGVLGNNVSFMLLSGKG